MRSTALLWVLVPGYTATVGCGSARGCLDRHLDLWCFHDESADGPVVPETGGDCPAVAFSPGPGAFACGDVDVSVESGGFTGRELYFDRESGALLAVRWWTDVNSYCGGFSFWYGQRMRHCEPTCTWDESDTGIELPPCP